MVNLNQIFHFKFQTYKFKSITENLSLIKCLYFNLLLNKKYLKNNYCTTLTFKINVLKL